MLFTAIMADLVIVAVLVLCALCWFLGRVSSTRKEARSWIGQTVVKLVDDQDDAGEYDPSLVGGITVHGRYMNRVVKMAKAEFGLLERTKANALMVTRFVRDTMREHGVRPSHIAHFSPVVTAMVFVPTSSDVMAAELMATTAVLDRVEHSQGWSEPSGWFRRARRGLTYVK